MNLYKTLRPLLFRLSPETAHHLALTALHWLPSVLLPHYDGPDEALPLMGLHFKNRLGLAAGLDKDGQALGAWARLGFGHLELGTVTPFPQPGNPAPRLFRLPEHRALINRMGFNNAGVAALVNRVKRFGRGDVIVGINLGKNKDTPNEEALNDYLYGLERAYGVADYLAINISSPNTAGLRDLQRGEALRALLAGLKQGQRRQQQLSGKYTPLVVKIAPDQEEEALAALLDALREAQVDGVIVSNTTLERRVVAGHPHAAEAGGLSGAPLLEPSTRLLRKVRHALPTVALIAAGGVLSRADYEAKLEAGADLVQLFTGLIYEGPGLLKECLA